jgi:hypothetical protein
MLRKLRAVDGEHNKMTDPETLLRRKAVAEALTAAGFPTSPATLATMATRGGGPVFRSYGRVPLYRWSDALAWAQSRMSAPRRTTSENRSKPVHASTPSAVDTAIHKEKTNGALAAIG